MKITYIVLVLMLCVYGSVDASCPFDEYAVTQEDIETQGPFLLSLAASVPCENMMRDLLEAGVNPNEFEATSIGWTWTLLCHVYLEMALADLEEDPQIREEKLAKLRPIRDLLLAHGAYCDRSLGDRQDFVHRFMKFLTNLPPRSIYAYLQNGSVIVDGDDIRLEVPLSMPEKEQNIQFNEWAVVHAGDENLNIAVIGITNNEDEMDSLYGLRISLRKHNIKIHTFTENSRLFVCDVPALIRLFQTHTLEEILHDQIQLLDSVCPDQGPKNMVSPEKEAELQAL